MLKLKAKIRKKLKRDNLIPAIIYGHKIKNTPLEVNYIDFAKLYTQAGETTLIDLEFGDEKRAVLIHDVQIDPVTDKYLHIDFYQVKMDEKIKTEVSLVFVGEAPGVVERGGILVKSIDKLEIESLPKDLPHEIQVDVSKLKEIEDHICVKDLDIPKGVEVLIDKEEVIAMIASPKVQEEEKPAEAAEEKPEGEGEGETKEESQEETKQENEQNK
ncbi:MAG: 50S ribosomal protein L25 [bacterium]